MLAYTDHPGQENIEWLLLYILHRKTESSRMVVIDYLQFTLFKYIYLSFHA